MQSLLTSRIQQVPRSFIREILKTATSPDIISFAGGLPNHDLFPVEAFRRSANNAIDIYGSKMFQYSNTEGFLPLREYIANQYLVNDGLVIAPHQILITNGSQQGLDLLSKVLIDAGDEVLIEEPGYLGAIQSMSVMGAKFIPIPLLNDGVDRAILADKLKVHNPKMFYTVPAFQNPSGVLYSTKAVEEISQLVVNKKMVVIEDTPYRQINFTGNRLPSFYSYLPNQTVILGSFSKTTAPGFRLGWMVAPDWLMDRLVVAKQASDLHTDTFSQIVLTHYLQNESPDKHIQTICDSYGAQSKAMSNAIKTYFPSDVAYNEPQGGMFFWITLPNQISSLKLFEQSILQKVAFVPGVPFYVDGREDSNTCRFNFTCSNETTINDGISRIGNLLKNWKY